MGIASGLNSKPMASPPDAPSGTNLRAGMAIDLDCWSLGLFFWADL
jgi:hypothetical protein